MSTSFRREVVPRLRDRLAEPRRFIQVLAGPRQVGKTTIVRQALTGWPGVVHSISADEPTLRGREWLTAAWEAARAQADVLVVDEIQKVQGWSEVVKRLWDDDTREGRALRVVLLGSSPLLLQRGMTESLAGRFELIRVSHWSFAEMQAAFGWDLDRFIMFGGYPGAASLVEDEGRWRAYVRDSLIETTVARDVLLLTPVLKPALLRRLVELTGRFTGQILSYTKMLGHLQDAGNTTTVAHYLDLLDGAGLATGLQKHAGNAVRRRASSPKLLVRNTALATAIDGRSFESIRADRSWWGRLVETAVGAHLANSAPEAGYEVFYWNRGDAEVDFVVQRGSEVFAIEVKSARARRVSGLEAFRAVTPQVRPMLVGADGIAIDRFLSKPAQEWLG